MSAKNFKLFFSVLLFFLSGCTLAKVDVTVVSERTSLENQILGTYNSLDREMLLVASVRGVDSSGQIRKPPKKSQDHKDSIASMQVLAFHEDDINAFKKLNWVGENNNGLLTQFEMKKETSPPELADFIARYTQEEFNSVVYQVNVARESVMRRVIDMNEKMSENDLPEVHNIFGKMNIQNALAGEKIQTKDGEWIIKK